MSLSNLFQDSSRVLTFTIANSHFGVDVNNILAFSDECDQIQTVEDNNTGFIGYLDYRDVLVNVYDSAAILNRRRNRDEQNELVSAIDTYKQAHIDWVAALEHAITSGEEFTLPRDPRMCAFGQWYYAFETQNQDLKALLDKIEKPHQEIHALADTLLELCSNGETARAQRILSIEKGTTLRKLLRILESAQDLLLRNIHPVLLHLTQDGSTPWYSIVLDEVDDIIDYRLSDLDTSATTALKQEPINGYLRQKNGDRYMMLCVNKLYNQVNKITPEETCNS
ncbi:CZB domain-containing protein [Neptunomonas sp. XY-337]|uniref:CZB domain-containing protein n=1 Tax=Neptunomonas sp. XY-337 TaxID=2561897 RepID=UPI0010AAC215|nr:CZB domain-containing protein [Neptunomonas sp. XY-337]